MGVKIPAGSNVPVNLKSSMNRGHPLLQAKSSAPLHSGGRRPPVPVKAPKTKTR